MKASSSQAVIATFTARLVLIFFALVSVSQAGIIQVATGYEVSYRMELYSGTQTGLDVQDVFIFEWNGSESNVDGTYTIAADGATTLSHTIGFAPTAAIVIGYLEGQAGVGDGKRHIYTLFDTGYHDYLVENFLGYKFSQIFGQGEQSTIDLIIAAGGGDTASLNELGNFVLTAMADAAFDPAGDFRILKWSILPPDGDGGSIPAPTTIALFGLGLAGLGWSRRKA